MWSLTAFACQRLHLQLQTRYDESYKAGMMMLAVQRKVIDIPLKSLKCNCGPWPDAWPKPLRVREFPVMS